MNSKKNFRFYFIYLLILISISITSIFSLVEERETSKVHHDGGNIFTLADLPVKCNDNEVLTHWQLIEKNNYISIKYNCIYHSSVSYESEEKFTDWNSVNKDIRKSLNFLDRHRLVCDHGFAIGAFRMEKSGNTIRFRYRCNKITPVSSSDRRTSWENSNFGEVQKLSIHSIYGSSLKSDNQVLRGWVMKTKYENRWCTLFCDSYHYIKFEIFYDTLAEKTKMDFSDN